MQREQRNDWARMMVHLWSSFSLFGCFFLVPAHHNPLTVIISKEREGATESEKERNSRQDRHEQIIWLSQLSPYSDLRSRPNIIVICDF
jgi:hypothetical protein